MKSLQGIIAIKIIHVAQWNIKIALFIESLKLLIKDNFSICIGHLILAISTLVKVIIFFIVHQLWKMIFWVLEMLRKLLMQLKIWFLSRSQN